jgi:hypothetical protein
VRTLRDALLIFAMNLAQWRLGFRHRLSTWQAVRSPKCSTRNAKTMSYSTCTDSRPKFDDRDFEIMVKRETAWNETERPRVGDFVIFPDGTERRFSHHRRDSIQTSDGGSLYLGKGYVSFSGGLHPAIPIDRFERDRGEHSEVWFWFFHHDFHGANRGVDCQIQCGVFRVRPSEGANV